MLPRDLKEQKDEKDQKDLASTRVIHLHLQTKKNHKRSLIKIIVNTGKKGAILGAWLGGIGGAAYQGAEIGRYFPHHIILNKSPLETLVDNPNNINDIISTSVASSVTFAAVFGVGGLLAGSIGAAIVGIGRGVDSIVHIKNSTSERKMESKEKRRNKKSMMIGLTVALGVCLFAKKLLENDSGYRHTQYSIKLQY